MKRQILDISDKLRNDEIDENEARKLLLNVFNINDGFVLASEKEPPHNIELLVKSPTGTIHLSSWRSAYGIFDCQCKSESGLDWSWKLI